MTEQTQKMQAQMDTIISEEKEKYQNHLGEVQAQLDLMRKDQAQNEQKIQEKTDEIERLIGELAQQKDNQSYLDVSIDQMNSTMKVK